MRKFEFKGIVVLKNGETKEFNEISSYNNFITENFENIESTSTSSRSVTEKSDKTPIELKDMVKLSDVITSAINTAYKTKSNGSLGEYNKIGESVENEIDELIKQGRLIDDFEKTDEILKNTCNDIKADSEDIIDYIRNIKRLISAAEKDLEKLNANLANYQTERTNNYNYGLFIDGLCSMCYDKFTTKEPTAKVEEIHEPVVKEAVNDDIFDLSKFLKDLGVDINNVKIFSDQKDPTILSNNVKRLIKALYEDGE